MWKFPKVYYPFQFIMCQLGFIQNRNSLLNTLFIKICFNGFSMDYDSTTSSDNVEGNKITEVKLKPAVITEEDPEKNTYAPFRRSLNKWDPPKKV